MLSWITVNTNKLKQKSWKAMNWHDNTPTKALKTATIEIALKDSFDFSFLDFEKSKHNQLSLHNFYIMLRNRSRSRASITERQACTQISILIITGKNPIYYLIKMIFLLENWNSFSILIWNLNLKKKEKNNLIVATEWVLLSLFIIKSLKAQFIVKKRRYKLTQMIL